MRAIDYIFYRLYNFEKFAGNRDNPQLHACILFALSSNTIFFSIMGFLYAFFQVKLKTSSPFSISLIVVTIFAVVFYVFLKDMKYVKIAERFANEPRDKQRWGHVFAVGYFFGTIALLMLSVFFMIQRNKGLL